MECSECHKEIDDSAWFCPLCGQQLVPDEAISGVVKNEAVEGPTTDTDTYTVTVGEDGLVEVRLEVEVIAGPDEGKRVALDSGMVQVGTSKEAHLQLSDRAVSHHHVELRTISDGVLLVDLGSKNGTRLNGAQIKRAMVQSGEVFELGGTKIRVTQRRRDCPTLEPSLQGQGTPFDRFVTANAKLKRSLQLLQRVSHSNVTVLIEGETGTGKDLLAQAIHQYSSRADAPYVIVDGGAVAPTLLESQLFGHKRGAFTGALEDQIGAFEAAEGGTVFLDELGEFALDLQPKLLRALESRTIRRLGEVTDRSINVRFVAATHRTLTDMVSDGHFRSDLYYRIAVVRVEIPPLRERPEDVPILAAHFVRSLSEGCATLEPDTFATLSQYDWPGNARELRNVLQRAIAVSETDRIGPESLFPEQAPATTFAEAKDQVVAAFEQRYARSLLERHGGNVSKAAREAGLSRPSLYALIKRTGIES